MSKIEIERSDLASFLVLANDAISNNLDFVKTTKMLLLMDGFNRAIKEFDRKQEIKEIGPNFKQQELF